MNSRRLALVAGLIVLLGAGFALTFAFPELFSPGHAATPKAAHAGDYEPKLLTPAEVKARLDRGDKVVIADVRGASSYAKKHITGARSMPASESSKWGPTLKDFALVVFYCSCPDDGASTATARLAEDHHGAKNVAVMAGGLKAWEQAGYPLTQP